MDRWVYGCAIRISGIAMCVRSVKIIGRGIVRTVIDVAGVLGRRVSIAGDGSGTSI